MFPQGFKPVTPAGRNDHIPVRLGVDKRQIMTVSFSPKMSAALALDGKKFAFAVAEHKVAMVAVAADQAGWDVTATKSGRSEVKIPVPALFNVVSPVFRQESITGNWDDIEGGIVIDLYGIVIERGKDRDDNADPEGSDDDTDQPPSGSDQQPEEPVVPAGDELVNQTATHEPGEHSEPSEPESSEKPAEFF